MDSVNENEDKRGKKISDRPANRFDNLPREVAVDLLSRLPTSSLMRFRFVSKSCQNLSFDPHLVNLHHCRTAINNTCLILYCGFPFGKQLHIVEFSDHNDKEIVRTIKPPFSNPMAEFNVVGSSNGLICLSNSRHHDPIHIFNPFTRSYKRLPDSRQFDHQKVVVGFGFHPLINEYKVVRIVDYEDVNVPYLARAIHGMKSMNSLSQVQVCSVGSNSNSISWRSIGKMPYHIDHWASEPFLVNGKLHWMNRSHNGLCFVWRIVSFDLADEQFRELPSPNWGRVMRSFPYPFAALGGCLSLVVHPRRKNLEIWVMKEYGVVESWIKHMEIDVSDSNPRVPPRTDMHVKVLCQTKNGGLLLMYDGALATYDPESRELKNVIFEGMPDSYRVFLHEGSLVWFENA